MSRLGDGRIHLIGVGGVGMAAVAELLVADGFEVSGSDAHEAATLPRLRALGVLVQVGHRAEQVDGASCVVVSTAIKQTNPELQRARELGITVLHRSQALAELCRDRTLVAVAGTHGKTTTTAMTVCALRGAGLDPSFAVGGKILGLDTGAHAGRSSVMVIEADESDGSFLNYSPDVAIVTNIEPDHLDHYGTAQAVSEAFETFAGRIKPGGLLIACAQDPGSARLASFARESGVETFTYGIAGGADVRITPTSPSSAIMGEEARPLELVIHQPGVHMLLNATAAYLAAFRCGAEPAGALRGLADFVGTGRRFELVGRSGGVSVYDDYAHHPTEITALLRAARQVSEGRLLVIFQPHLYSRTRIFAKEFARALEQADDVTVLDVYAAREDPIPGVTGALIADRIEGISARFEPDVSAAVCRLAQNARPGDMILTVGAGDVTALAPQILEKIERHEATR